LRRFSSIYYYFATKHQHHNGYPGTLSPRLAPIRRLRHSSTRQSSSSDSSAPQLSLKKTSSTLSKTFSFGRRDNSKKNEEKIARKQEAARKRREGRTYKHPSEKPLTEQNLKHQEMLSHFTMTFGASDPSQIIDPDFDGISPCCTRACSIDLGSTLQPGIFPIRQITRTG
jgi:hypothetical protein